MTGELQGKIDDLEKLIALGHLSSGVGHHVINAFSAIVSSAELLRLDPATRPPGEAAALAETIIGTAMNAATVARRLIDYSRPLTSIEPHRASFEPTSIALHRHLAELIPSFQSTYHRSVQWRFELEPVPSLKGHPEQLASMMSLMLDNAVEALGSDGGTIALRTEVDSRGWIALEIRDDGSGMTHSTLERAVEPFFSTKPGHLGVGLSIAHGIWRRHRGTLAVQSNPGEGTRIRLCVEPARENG